MTALYGEAVGYVPCPDAPESALSDEGRVADRETYFVPDPCVDTHTIYRYYVQIPGVNHSGDALYHDGHFGYRITFDGTTTTTSSVGVTPEQQSTTVGLQREWIALNSGLALSAKVDFDALLGSGDDLFIGLGASIGLLSVAIFDIPSGAPPTLSSVPTRFATTGQWFACDLATYPHIWLQPWIPSGALTFGTNAYCYWSSNYTSEYPRGDPFDRDATFNTAIGGSESLGPTDAWLISLSLDPV